MAEVTVSGRPVLIDDEDLPLFSSHNWFMSGDKQWPSVTAWRLPVRPNRKLFILSRLLMDAPEDKLVDHVNGDPLDNRKSNLRLVTHQQNMCNRKRQKNNASGLTGVYFDKRNGKWWTELTHEGRRYWTRYHDTKEQAQAARHEQEVSLRADFIRANRDAA